MQVTRWTEADMAGARALFESTRLSLTMIGLRTGVPRSTVQLYAKRNGWRRPKGAEPDTRTPPSLVRAQQAFRMNAAARRVDILARALALAERHIAEAEDLRAAPTADILAREREARFISTVITLVQRHQQAEAAIAGSAGAERDRSTDDAADPAPRSLDAIYRDFACHLAALFGTDPGAGPAAGLGGGGPRAAHEPVDHRGS